MRANTTTGPSITARGDYVLLTADTLRLLLPKQDVGAAEFRAGMLEASEAPGLLKLRGTESLRRFAVLSGQMRLLPHCPDDRRLMTSVGNGGDDVAWCWNALRELPDVELPLYPIPKVLFAANAPVEAYVEVDGELAYLCSAHRLRAFATDPGAEQ